MLKLGPHCIGPSQSAKAMVAAGFKIVKLLDDFGPAEEFLKISPALIVIGRVYSPFDAQKQYHEGLDPEVAAMQFVESQRPKYELNPLVKLWEGHNEPVWNTPEEMLWYSRFESARLRIMTELGLRCVIGNFPVGNPDLGMWQYFTGALADCIALDGVLGLHEYSTPWVWWMTGRYQMDPLADEGDEGWVTLRYRKVLRALPEHLRQVKVAITEFGMDRVQPVRPGYPSERWKGCTSFWNTQSGQDDPVDYWRGEERDPEKYYAEQLIWYGNEIEKDANVLGATIFTLNTNNPAWSDLDIAGTGVAEHLIERAADFASPPVDTDPDGNLIKHLGSFETGYYHWNNVPELAIPNGFQFWYQTDKQLRLDRQDQAFDPPETVVWNKADAQLEERNVFFLSGDHCLKVFKGWGVIWWRLWLTYTQLTPGRSYLFTAPIFPDLYVSKNGAQKIWAPDPLSGEAMLEVRSHGRTIATTGWIGGPELKFGTYNLLSLQFTADGPSVDLVLEARGRWGLLNNGWFVDSLALDEIPDLPPTSGKVEVERNELLRWQDLASELSSRLSKYGNG